MIFDEATPEERRSGTCAAFVSFKMHERKGPRGGRITTVTATCARCGHTTHELKTRRPGSGDAEARTLRATLLQRTCPKPCVEDDATALLRELADVIERGERIPLAFAVRHLHGSMSLADATWLAWQRCEIGFVMARLLYVGDEGRVSPIYWPSQTEDGTRCDVRGDADGCAITIAGLQADVANVLRRVIGERTVREIARKADASALGAA